MKYEEYLVNNEYYILPKKVYWDQVAELKEFTPNYHSNHLVFPEGEINMEGILTINNVSRKVWVGEKK